MNRFTSSIWGHWPYEYLTKKLCLIARASASAFYNDPCYEIAVVAYPASRMWKMVLMRRFIVEEIFNCGCAAVAENYNGIIFDSGSVVRL